MIHYSSNMGYEKVIKGIKTDTFFCFDQTGYSGSFFFWKLSKKKAGIIIFGAYKHQICKL
jgi:hypothetical protein